MLFGTDYGRKLPPRRISAELKYNIAFIRALNGEQG